MRGEPGQSSAGVQDRLVVHVGLGKTATTVLQRQFMRRAGAALGIEPAFHRDVADFIRAREAGQPVGAFRRAAGRMFLSSEALAGWDARHWRRNVAVNQGFFGADATVLLLIRRPSARLRSVYQQRCHHRGEWLSARVLPHRGDL